MAPKEDITPLVGGLDFDVISPDLQKQVAVATRKLFHKTPESREKGLQMLQWLKDRIGIRTLESEVHKTAFDYADLHPDKAETVIGALLITYKTLFFSMRTLAQAIQYASRNFEAGDHRSFHEHIFHYLRMVWLFRMPWSVHAQRTTRARLNPFRFMKYEMLKDAASDPKYPKSVKVGDYLTEWHRNKPSPWWKLTPLFTFAASFLGAKKIQQYQRQQYNLYRDKLNEYMDSLEPGSPEWTEAMRKLKEQIDS